MWGQSGPSWGWSDGSGQWRGWQGGTWWSGGPAVMAAEEPRETEQNYVLCVLLVGAGMPWSEHKPGTPFTAWFTRTLQDT